MATQGISVLVLGGGPDAEREVSLRSARAVAEALRIAGAEVHERNIDRASEDELRDAPGDVVFPALHGPWGEGGPLQAILTALGRPYVGSTPRSCRLAMDKCASKAIAQGMGIPTPAWQILDVRDDACAFDPPFVVKPTNDGSTFGLRLCRDKAEWERALASVREEVGQNPGRVYMIEPMVTGLGGALARELTVGLLDGQALPVIEICPSSGLYDFDAKYERDDTAYHVNPAVPLGVAETIQRQSEALAAAMGLRHVARADFMLDASGTAWFLEINSMPGFTDHSLVPMAARHIGIEMPQLCAGLVQAALRDAGVAPREAPSTITQRAPDVAAGTREG